MRIPYLTLLLVAGTVTALPLSAAQNWAVISAAKRDARITRQLREVAGKYRAQIRFFPSLEEAARHRPKVSIELRQEENLDAFLQVLRREVSNSPTQPTKELAREAYVLEIFYPPASVPNRIRVTAATDAGFHQALLRVQDLLRLRPSDLSTALAPPAQTVRVAKEGDMAVVADFPSFPERGVVEGFYGTPWRHQDRLDMLRFEGQHGMNVYYYAPKDDPYHRKLWREHYPPAQTMRLGELVDTARANFVDFCFAISPGLSIVYSNDEDFAALAGKLQNVGKLGVSCFALFLDDVPQDLQSPEDRRRYKTLAQAHTDLINRLYRHLKSQSEDNRLVVTPTTYTNEWGSREYIRELGAGVNQDVAIVWTGPEVASPTITMAQAKEWGEYLHGKPLVWDNFPVNDGRPWRLHLGPLRGRDGNLPAAVRGLFSNPMNQPRASMLPLQTVADYLWNSTAYDPERSFQKAVTEQYGKGAPAHLAPFLKAYGDYWWDENLFTPLFVERRYSIDVARIRREIGALAATLLSLRRQPRYQKLARELSPFPAKARAQLAAVLADPAFRRLPGQKLQWREDYDVLSAPRVNVTPKLDGDFAKWQSSPLYTLDKATQVFTGRKFWRGPSQFSARVALGWDGNYFYLGMDVTDPDLYQPFSGRGIDKGDVFILRLETAFRKKFESTRADGDEYLLFFSPGNFAGVEPSIFSEEDYLPPRSHPRDCAKEIKTAWRKTPAGFSGDIAVPISYFDGGKFSAGYEIGMSFDAQKVLAPASGNAGTNENGKRIVFRYKKDRLFPADFGNPASYQRLVLVEPQAKTGSASNQPSE